MIVKVDEEGAKLIGLLMDSYLKQNGLQGHSLVTTLSSSIQLIHPNMDKPSKSGVEIPKKEIVEEVIKVEEAKVKLKEEVKKEEVDNSTKKEEK